MGKLGELAELDATGDTKTIWDTDKPAEVDAARATFDALRKKGYLIYRVGEDGEEGKQMHQFEPKAGKMIAVPPIVGG